MSKVMHTPMSTNRARARIGRHMLLCIRILKVTHVLEYTDIYATYIAVIGGLIILQDAQTTTPMRKSACNNYSKYLIFGKD